jgi:hypothetical protein
MRSVFIGKKDTAFAGVADWDFHLVPKSGIIAARDPLGWVRLPAHPAKCGGVSVVRLSEYAALDPEESEDQAERQDSSWSSSRDRLPTEYWQDFAGDVAGTYL